MKLFVLFTAFILGTSVFGQIVFRDSSIFVKLSGGSFDTLYDGRGWLSTKEAFHSRDWSEDFADFQKDSGDFSADRLRTELDDCLSTISEIGDFKKLHDSLGRPLNFTIELVVFVENCRYTHPNMVDEVITFRNPGFLIFYSLSPGGSLTFIYLFDKRRPPEKLKRLAILDRAMKIQK